MKKQIIFVPHLHKDPEKEAKAIATLCRHSYIGIGDRRYCVYQMSDFKPVEHCPFCSLFEPVGATK